MPASIPASAIVNVYPSVIDAGGSGLDLGGLVLTNDDRVPIGSAFAFTSQAAVADFFGALSTEATIATHYFLGYDNSPIKPARLLFVQYPAAAVKPYVHGGDVSALTLTQLRAISGTLIFTINGQVVTSSNIDLSAVSSFSGAAGVIATAIGHYDAVVTGSIAATTLTVTAVASGALAAGQVISGSGITAGTKIVAQLTGTAGGVGTYTVDVSQTAASTSISAAPTTAEYDANSGGFVIRGGTPGAPGTITLATGTAAAGLKLGSAGGAYASQGAAAFNALTAMAGVTNYTQDFATFLTAFKPSISDMVAFANWTNSTLNRWAYVMWDNDLAPTTATDTTSAGHQIQAADYSGTIPIFDPVDGLSKAAFIMGAIASIDFERPEGRVNLAFLSQAGLLAGVTDRTIADNLKANGYNWYGSYATANENFVWLYPGTILGDFLYVDSYVNQIWLNNAFQLALMNLLRNIHNLPYTPAGYGFIEQALADPINAAVEFGAIRPGVTLTAAQAAQVNQAAGKVISTTLQNRGWYLQIFNASPEVRAARGSPPITFWYTDGQSVQSINMNSVELI